MKKHTVSILLGVIIVIAAFIRLVRLEGIPNGLYQDETSIGYNAYSILITGKDEYGRPFPIYFESFGDWKLPVYIYTTVAFVKLFGLSAWAVRLPSALYGILTVGVLYFFVKTFTKNEKLSLVSAFLLAINPWHIHYSRAAFEVSIALFFLLLGTLFLKYFFIDQKRGGLFAGTLCFLVVMYSYNLTRLLAPVLFCFVGAMLVRNSRRRFGKKEIFVTVLCSFVLLLPIVLTFFTNGGVASAQGTLITSSAYVKAPILELRSYFTSFPQAFTKLLFNTYLLTFLVFLKHIVSYFSVDFYFLTGSTHGNHGNGLAGQLYLFELLTIPIGFMVMKRRYFSFWKLIIGWIGLSILVASLTREAPHATRSFFLVPMIVIFSSAGLIHLYDYARAHIIRNSNNRIHFLITISAGLGIMTYLVVQYFLIYFVVFPVSYAANWRSLDEDVVRYIENHRNEYDRIVIDKNAGLIYSSILFYTKYPPHVFQTEAVRAVPDSEGFHIPVSFPGYEYHDDFALPVSHNEKILFVGKKESIPSQAVILEQFDYPVRPVVMAIGQSIVSYPTRDSGYTLFTY